MRFTAKDRRLNNFPVSLGLDCQSKLLPLDLAIQRERLGKLLNSHFVAEAAPMPGGAGAVSAGSSKQDWGYTTLETSTYSLRII